MLKEGLNLRGAKEMYPWLLLIFWFGLHIPFLGADPDTLVDVHTRGAWTDEGLYSGTARNFLNTGTIDLHENSLLTRGPLQTVLQIPLFFIFGQSLLVARLMTLVGVLLAFIFFMKHPRLKMAGVGLLLVGFTQFHLFHFSHYAMAEAFSTACILLSIVFMIRAFDDEGSFSQWRRHLFVSAVMLFVAYGMKIQFVYIAPLLPAVALIQWVVSWIRSGEHHTELRKKFVYATAFTAIFAAVYVVLWYLPNKEFYHYVMSREVDSRFPATLSGIFEVMRFNFDVLLFVPYLKPLILAGGVSLLVGGVWLLVSPSGWTRAERILFLASFLWLLLELHKVSMTYMPHRYLVPAYASVALLISTLLSAAYRQKRWLAVVVMVWISLTAGWQLRHTHEAWQRRSWDLKAVNTYLRGYDWSGKTISGAWGPSAAWGTKARVFPVWGGFLNDERALDATMIIAESDQEDSGESLLRQGIDLDNITDSLRRFPVWRYEVDLRWIHLEED